MLTELKDDFRQTVRMKLISRGINPSTISENDLDQYSSEDDSRYAGLVRISRGGFPFLLQR